MKIKLRNNFIVNTDEIKFLRNKPMRLYVSFGKEKRADYTIEWLDDTFTEITKKEYKLLLNILEKNNEVR